MENQKDNVSKLYQGLLKNGYTQNELGDEAKFRQRMSDVDNRKMFYDYAKSRGDSLIGDYDTYMSRLDEAYTQPKSDDDAVFEANEERFRNGQPTERVTTQSMIDAHPELGLGEQTVQKPSVKEQYILDNRPDMFGKRNASLMDVPLGNAAESPELSGDKLQARIDVAQRNLQDKEYQKGRTKAQLRRLNQDVSDALGELQERVEVSQIDRFRPANLQSMPVNPVNQELMPEYTALRKAQRLAEESENIINEAEKKGNTNFMAGLARGFWDNLNAEDYTFGADDAAQSAYLYQALDKADRGEQLTKAEETLLDAAVINMATQAYFAQDLGKGYGAGSVTAESIPFMLEMAINPISASGKTSAKMLLKYGLKKFANNKAAKVGARLLGDALAATGMAATTGSGDVLEGTTERLAKNYDYGVDADGNLYANKKADAMGMGEAFARSFTTRAIENQSEMIFKAFEPIGGFMKGVQDVLPGGVNKFFDMLSHNKVADAYRWLKKSPVFRNYLLKDVRNATQIGGIFEEYAEEVYNNLANFAIGEMSWDDVVSLDKNIDTFLGLAPTQAMFGLLGLGGASAMRYQTRRTLEDLQATMNEQQRKQLEGLLDMGLDAEEVDVRGFIRNVMQNENYTIDNKRDMIKAAFYVAKQKGIDQLTEADVIDKVNAENSLIDSVTDPSTGLYSEVVAKLPDAKEGTIEVPGNVVGWFGEGEKRQPIFVAEGMENTEENRRVLKPGEWDASSVQEMPAEQVKTVNEEMIREEEAVKAELESKYAPEVLSAQMQQGVPFNTPTSQIVPVSPMPEGNGWIVEEYAMDENGKPSKNVNVREFTNDEYRDMLQAQLDAEQAVVEELAQSSESVGEQVESVMNTEVNNPEASGESMSPVEVAQQPQVEAQQAPVIPTKEDGSIDFVTYGKEGSFKTLGEKYGEKMPNKVAVTAKALADDLKKAQERLAKAEEAYDNTPIGREEKAEKARDKAQQELDAIKREADFWAEMDAEIKSAQLRRSEILNPQAQTESSNEPMTADEFVAQQLAAGNIVLNKDDYMRETGFGSEEANAMNGGAKKLLGAEGMTIQEAGERLMEMDRENGTNFFDQSDSNAGRDALISVLGSVKSRKELNQYIANNRAEQAKRDSEGLRSEAEKAVMDANFSSLEDFVLQMEAAEVENPFMEDRADEIMAIFAEEAAKYEQSLNNTENEQGRTNEVAEGSDTILSEEQSDDTGGTEERSESERVGDGIVEEGESAHVGGQADEVELKQQEGETILQFAERVAEENRRRPLRKRANEWSKALGVKVTLLERIDDVDAETRAEIESAHAKGKGVPGWVNSKGVFFFMPDLQDMKDVDDTYVHEVVAHVGIEKMLGKERFAELCDKVWEMMPQSAKDFYEKKYPGVKDIKNETLRHRRAADEYIAHLAEDENLTPEEKTIWDNIVKLFRDMLDKALNGIIGKSKITNEDISNLIKASYANLKSGAEDNVSGEGKRFRVVYHGSAADFDKFDHSKMGSGAGSQVFGWGTYVSELEKIGRDYGDVALQSENRFTYVGDKDVNKWTVADAEQIMHTAGSYEEAIKRYGNATLAPGTALEQAVTFLKSTKKEDWQGKRHLYEVEIPDAKRGNYIIYGNNVTDAAAKKVFDGVYNRLSKTEEYDNPTARKELKRELDDLKSGYGQGQSGIWKDLYGDISYYLGSDKEASLFLRSLGYVGIKYPAGTIYQGDYGGASNYVIFDENDLQIVNHTRFRMTNAEKEELRDSEETKALFDYAKKRFGRTFDLREAGYILPDGVMLDFSGRHEMKPGSDTSHLAGYRSVDHRYVSDLNYEPEDDGGEKTGFKTDMADFINRGAIRMDGNIGSINLTMKPTSKQKIILQRLSLRMDGDVWVDFGNGWDTEHSAEYSGVRPMRVLSDIDKYYDEGIKPEGNTRFRFIGERGARNLDKAEEATTRLDNLSVAREMEAAEKDAKAIKMATGWERGADGLWRYETEDIDISATEKKLRERLLEDDRNYEEKVASAVIYNDEIQSVVDAYPDWNVDILVYVGQRYDNTGSYKPGYEGDDYYMGYTPSIEIKAKTVSDVRRLLSHEIQHAIQEIEGFAEGGSLSSAYEEIENVKYTLGIHGKASISDIVSYLENGLETPVQNRAINDLAKKKGYNNAIDYVRSLNPFNYYKRISGEVEARNVESRLGMTLEERRVSLATETEDVAREDQLFLQNAMEEGQTMFRIADSDKQKQIDEEYVDAVREGDFGKAIGLFREYVLSKAEENGVVPIDYGVGYRSHSHSSIAKKVKEENPDAISEAAYQMSKRVPKGSILVPMPSRSGNATYTIKLAEAIAKATESEVRDVLKGNERMSVYEAKKKGLKIDSRDLGFYVTEKLPKDRNVVIVDNVIDRGITALAAVEAVDGGSVLAYAFTKGSKDRVVPLKLSDPITYDDELRIIPLSERFNSATNDLRFRIAKEPAVDYISQSDEVVDVPQNEVKYTMNNVASELYKVSGDYMRELYKDGVLGRVLRGEYAEIDQIKAKEDYDKAKKYLGEYLNELIWMKYQATEAAQDVINDVIRDVEYSIDYYRDLTLGKDVWRTKQSPRFRIVEKKKEAIQQEVDKFTSKYNSVPVDVIESGMTDKELVDAFDNKFGIDDIRNFMKTSKTMGGYIRGLNKVIIFADRMKPERMEESLFHENIHALMYNENHTKLLAWFYEFAKDDEAFAKWREISENKEYELYERPEEFFAYVVSNGMVADDLEGVLKHLDGEMQNELKELLNKIGYNYDVRRRSIGQSDNGRTDEGTSEESVVSGDARKTAREQAERLGNLFGQVADMGLDGVLGNKEYTRLMVDIYKELPEDVRTSLADDALRHYGGSIAPAVSDYVNKKGKANLWDKIAGFIREALRKVGIDVNLNANDAKYILWRSRKPLDRNNLLDVAEDIDMRYRLKVGEFEDSPTRFRVKKPQKIDLADERPTIIKEYDKELKTSGFNFQEAFQDRMLSVKVLMEKIEAETGKKARSFENAYEAENQLSSKNKVDQERWLDKFYRPLLEELQKLSDKYGLETVRRYVYCKSGLERNVVLRQRDADAAYNEAKDELDDKLAKGDITQAQYDVLLDKAEDQRNKTLSEDIDYSGLRGMLFNVRADELFKQYKEGNITEQEYKQKVEDLKKDKANVIKDWKDFAEVSVSDLESRATSAEIDALWGKINAATNETLRIDFESGMIDRETYEAEKKMMKYYVPLRNWSNTTAEDMYEYRHDMTPAVTSNQKTAKGRESEADNPIATIALMAQNAIVRGNRNKMKMAFYSFVVNRPTALASVRNVWYVRDANNQWQPQYADTSAASSEAEMKQIIEQFENNMKQLEAQGDAFRGKQKIGMNFRASGKQRDEHVVVVMINGKEYAVYVNGNPRAAQAMNGLTNNEAVDDAAKWIDALKRYYGAGLTSWNPDFIIPNLVRDTIHATTMTFLDKGVMASVKYAANVPRMFSHVAKEVSGVSTGDPKLHQYFEEFVANGGETGYTAIHTLEDYKKEYDKLMNEAKGLKGTIGNNTKEVIRKISKVLEAANRIAEDVNRFNAYVTSRESGAGVVESVSAAKNITVNFNRKGALNANHTVYGKVASWMSRWILFFNPSVQGIYQLVTKTKENPKRATALGASILASGFFVPMINDILVSMFGDDDDDYWNQSDYKRRNNWMLFVGDGYISVPLPPVLRELYGIGDIMYGVITGHIPAQRAVYDLLKQVQSAVGFVNVIPEVSQEPDMITYVKGFAPDIVAPFMDVISNSNFMGRPIAKWTDYNESDPEYERVYKGVGKHWVELSKFMNELGGNETRRSANWGNFINPAMMEHLFTSYTGGIGKTINNLAGMIIDAANGDTENMDVFRKTPVLRRFYTPNDEKTVVPGINRKFYEFNYQYNNAKKSLKKSQDAVNSGEHPEWQKYIDEMKENGEYEFIQYFEKENKKLKKIQNLLKGNPSNKKELEKQEIDKKAEIAAESFRILRGEQ